MFIKTPKRTVDPKIICRPCLDNYCDTLLYNLDFWGKNKSPVLGQAAALGDDISVKMGDLGRVG
jgi:hypothetical protein